MNLKSSVKIMAGMEGYFGPREGYSDEGDKWDDENEEFYRNRNVRVPRPRDFPSLEIKSKVQDRLDKEEDQGNMLQ